MPKTRAILRKTRPLTSAQLGRFGESAFEAMCTSARLIAQRPTYDINGWDFLVEFPHMQAEANADLVRQKPPIQCFIQVKTVWQGAKEVDLGLSAAARLGKAALPSFLCILEASEVPEIRRLHVMHMGDDLLTRVLRKLRILQSNGQSTLINKADFRLPVPKDSVCLVPTGAELVRAIENIVGDNTVAYMKSKAEFLGSSGFSANSITGTISVEVRDQEEYSNFLLGLSARLRMATGWGEQRAGAGARPC